MAKSTRASFLAVFPQTFDGLFHLCADADASVQSATAFLDRLVKVIRSDEKGVGRRVAAAPGCGSDGRRAVDILKQRACLSLAGRQAGERHSCPAVAFPLPLLQDIVAESHDFSAETFVPTLEEYLQVMSPHQRQFLLGWLNLLDRCGRGGGEDNILPVL